MANLMVVPVSLEGFPGGPGTNTFHFNETLLELDNLRAFYTSFSFFMPNSITVNFPTTGVTVNDANGDLVSIWNLDAVLPQSGGNGAAYARGVGATVRWNTEAVVNSHLVRGRTYMVPLCSTSFESNGTLKEADRTDMKNAADTLRSDYDGSMVVWHRPVDGAGGSSHLVTSTTVPDKPAWLSSRRD